MGRSPRHRNTTPPGSSDAARSRASHAVNTVGPSIGHGSRRNQAGFPASRLLGAAVGTPSAARRGLVNKHCQRQRDEGSRRAGVLTMAITVTLRPSLNRRALRLFAGENK